jgi:hypothetical protein
MLVKTEACCLAEELTGIAAVIYVIHWMIKRVQPKPILRGIRFNAAVFFLFE